MDQFKKGGKLQNSNLFATNRLFAKNPLFKKRKKKAPGIYNPNAKYKYPDGGLVQVRGYEGNKFRKNANGKWEYESGAPVTDPLLIQKLTYEAVPVSTPVVQGAPKVTIKPIVTSQQRIQKINDLSKSPRIADQEEAARLAEEQRNIDIYNPEVTPEEKIKPKGLQDLRNLEWDINATLGYPFEKAHTAAAAATSDAGEEVDNFRHPLAGRYTTEAIRDYVADVPYESIPLVGGYVNDFMDNYAAPSLGFIGSNLLGAGHEFMTLNNPGDDDRSLLSRLAESGEDLYNNYIGSKVGASNMTPEQKTNYLLYLSYHNKLPDGVVIEHKPKPGFSNNLYFKKGPKDPGSYNSKYAAGGTASPKDLDPEHMKKYLAELRNQENDARKGYRNGMWYPHRSVEGGADTIAYGHKLTPNDAYLRKGITEEQANALQEQDVLKNQALAKKQVDKKYGAGTFDSLPQDSQMLLVDYQYNLGTLSGFPSFVKATVQGDKEGMLKEHKRYGAGIPLTRRNDWTASVINNMNVPEPFDPNQITIPLGNIPDNTTVVNPIPVQPLPEVPIPPKAKGGEIELDIPESEIAFYVNGGYVVEDISVPSLNRMDNGGTLYTYAGNPNASYQKIGNQWYISHKGTGNKFVPIQDPDGKRAAELNKNAVVLPGQSAPVEQPRGVQGNVSPAKLPGQAKMELSFATRTAPTVQNQEKIKTLKAEVKKESDQAAEIARKKQIEKEKEEAALLLAQSNPSDNPNGINSDVILPQPSKLGYEFDQDKERYLRNLEINQALNSGNAALVLGDAYHNPNNQLSLRDMVAQNLGVDYDKFEKANENANNFRRALVAADYDRFLKAEEETYNNLGLLDKGFNEAANFLADPIYTGGQWLGGNRTLVGQGYGVRDDSNPTLQAYYNKATGLDNDWANSFFNVFNPGNNGANLAVNWNNNNAVGAAGDLASILLKGKVASQGLKATSAELGDLLKENIARTPVTGNHLLKGYSVYEGGTKYLPRTVEDIGKFRRSGNYSDLADALYSTGKVAVSVLPYTKFNDANKYPAINEVKSLFSNVDSSVKGVSDPSATDYHFKTVEKANKLGEQLKGIKSAAENLKKPIALSTFLRFAKPQKTGGSVETELTEQEIQDLIAQGYVIEQV